MSKKAPITQFLFRTLAVAGMLTLSAQAYAIGDERTTHETHASDEVQTANTSIVEDGCVILGSEASVEGTQVAFFKLPPDWVFPRWRA